MFVNALKHYPFQGGKILVGIIVVAIAVASCVSLTIRDAASEAALAGSNLLAITASIGEVDGSRSKQRCRYGHHATGSASLDASGDHEAYGSNSFPGATGRPGGRNGHSHG